MIEGEKNPDVHLKLYKTKKQLKVGDEMTINGFFFF